MTVRSGISDAPKRREDLRFLTGSGRYLDDLPFDGVAHAVVLRSQHAHAEIRAIDTAAAVSMPGVLAVLTADDSSFLVYEDVHGCDNSGALTAIMRGHLELESLSVRKVIGVHPGQ